MKRRPELSERRRRNGRFVAALLFVGVVASVVSSLGAPLVPAIADEHATRIASAQWALTASLLVAAVASPVVGRLGDGRRRKTVILVCLCGVLAGGILSAIAGSLGVLILGRALQGLGLAVVPLTMAAARDHLPPANSPRVLAMLAVTAAAGAGVGFPLTGAVAELGGVAAAFWFSAAVSALALLAAWHAIPPATPAADTADRPLDLPGAALVGGGVLALLLGVEKGPDWGWDDVRTLGLLLAAGAVLAGWAAHELRVRHPLVELRLLRNRAVLTANVAGFSTGVAIYTLMVVVTQFVQLEGFGLGASIVVSGSTLLPMSIVSLATSRALPAIEARVGVRPIVPAGALAIGVASLVFVVSTDLWQIFVMMAVLGIGVGCTAGALPGLIAGSVPATETGSALGFLQVSRFVGFSVGSGVAVTLVRAFTASGAQPDGAFHATAVVAAGLALLAAIASWALPGFSPPLARRPSRPDTPPAAPPIP